MTRNPMAEVNDARSPERSAFPSRRALLGGLGMSVLAGFACADPTPGGAVSGGRVRTGADVVAASGFEQFRGKRVGLVANQTSRSGADHLADLLAAAPGVTLAAILAPEHGFRGAVEAGAAVADGRDARTGVPVWSLYGATRRPTESMLRGLDVLVFDLQDIGARFYTYISTMGLAMQAASEAGVPFVVLDRPNPLGGDDVSGFVVEPRRRSFVGQYPTPIVHGMTVGELARMIKGEVWLPGLDRLELDVVAVEGWSRRMRWPDTGLAWRPTSPNIPTFLSALVYPGMGLVGETLVNEGRGTERPFQQFGAPWLDGDAMAGRLDGSGLPGVRFRAVRYTPRAIANVAADPRFRDQSLGGVSLEVFEPAAYRPLETGMHVLAALAAASRSRRVPLFGRMEMFYATCGTARLSNMLEKGASGTELVAAWRDEVARFRERRAGYLLYA